MTKRCVRYGLIRFSPELAALGAASLQNSLRLSIQARVLHEHSTGITLSGALQLLKIPVDGAVIGGGGGNPPARVSQILDFGAAVADLILQLRIWVLRFTLCLFCELL